VQPSSRGRYAMSLPCLLDMTHPLVRGGHETVHGGPGEHLAGTGARTVLRVLRNVLGVLPILTNTRPYSLSQCELGQDVDNFVTSSAIASSSGRSS
jgi:hypothetical protein